jgi:hypothetical protein
MYTRFGKVIHFISILVFIFALLYSYAALSDMVAYEVGDRGEAIKLIGKSQFFYSGILIFLFLNIIIATPAKLIEYQYSANIKRLFPKGDIYRDYLLAWLYSFIGIINISLSILVLFVHRINNPYEIEPAKFAFFFYIVPVFFVVWVVGLIYIGYKKFQEVSKK